MQLEEAIEKLRKRAESGNVERSEFWKIVGAVKRRKSVDEKFLTELAKIRDEIFDKEVVLSAETGNYLFPLLFIAFNAAFFLAALIEAIYALKAILLVFLEMTVLYFSFLTGRVVGAKLTGIKIEGYYKYNPFEFGMKLDIKSYLKVSQKRRVLFFLTPILFEYAVLSIHVLALYSLKVEFYWVPSLLVVANALFSYVVYKVKKTGELYRFLRELKILKELSEKPSAQKD